MSDRIALALIQHLVRTDQFDADDINAIADALENAGEGSAAHLVRVQLIEAFATNPSDWEAERRRARMRLVDVDGGNAE